MAEVYLAEQRLLRRRVAVKILKPDLADDRTFLKRFELEACAAASLVHANIVQIYEVGHVQRLHFIAQEYVQGQNLLEWINRHGPPDLPRALSIIRQVAAALAKAAEQGVVHRDIKPENIMLTRSGEVKVADFGLARLTREGEAVDLTQVGVTMGTPLYMSPEQVEGKPPDPRSDLYSFGVTCYHMLTGSPPFRSETALGMAVQHLKNQPEPLESLRSDLPAALCQMVHKMLEKDPRHRYQSARLLLRDLHRLYLQQCDDDWPEDLADWETTGLELPADERTETTQQLEGLMRTVALPRPGRRARRLLWIGMASVFLLGGAVAWLTTARPSLLAGADAPAPGVLRQPTALLQYLHASRIGTEAAWQSVSRHFPDNRYLGKRAQQQLALIYLRKGYYDRALAIFDELAAADEPSEFRAFGLAGQYGLFTIRREHTVAAIVLDELWPLRLDLRDPAMRQLFEAAMRINRFKLEERTALGWDQFLADHFPEDD